MGRGQTYFLLTSVHSQELVIRVDMNDHRHYDNINIIMTLLIITIIIIIIKKQ